ncbi:class I SAM-dependent methyltransferase [Halalkalibacter alkalisediminis]|uniref:Class I SAM-dependent methyltransferase n=1 Tax=Halalkalibacter alkalisediminis TaxID=935616 RepID=A0ABV6NHZ4_9BACI|nr:methyltransferase domain-containing protein [Halalkalibacter alkalisediminis]
MNKKSSKEEVQEQFGKNANHYVTSKTHAKGQDLHKLIDIAEVNGPEIVLDIATGGGHVANALASKVNKVIALDLTSEILLEAKRFIDSNGHSNVEFVQGDAEQLPFEDHTFDLITCRIAAHHFPNPRSFVEEVFRTLKNKGTFLFIDNVAPEKDELDAFYNTVEKDRDYSHFRAWKKTEWIQMMEEVGFELEELHTFKKTFIFDVWAEMMKLSAENQNKLSAFMQQSSQTHHDKFRIKVADGQVTSFTGESVLIKTKKS